MLSDEIIDKVIERLVRRIEEGNIYTLKKIGNTLKEIKDLTPSDTHRLVQIINSGGDYDKILKKLSEITKLNEKEIYKIFEEVAKKDYQFAEKFYKYRNKKYISWDNNVLLQNQVRAIAELTANEYRNISRTLAFSKKVNGKVVYADIGYVYQDLIDRAVMSVGQGKETFEDQFRQTVKELARSGIRTVNWESGVSRRLDSAVRMNLKQGLRNLHNQMQDIIGEEIGADGVEISVHNNPAPDHEEAQGRQFRKEEYDKLQETGIAKDINGREINLHRKLKKKKGNSISFRPISFYNCYHYVFSVIIGVNEPQYTEEQLKEIINNNEKGFDFEGNHYTMYEGEQLQRKIETEIRKAKDEQIIGVASGDKEIIADSEKRIDLLLSKYMKLSKESGLPTKLERLQVEGYKRIKLQ